ncbi:ATP-binding protein [Spirulina sp. CCNP1310]|uniref:sensor histidine kinase n=1 Tax=Spirulina sp. CCNP1310 TaxID=3110249 RepID=UPI002B1F727F|nr:ATP-binding protein [Spirulina sp. CCNP1310]MEA5421128.1 ATP-binding protein [Spirulina sp. CCNP1310]
MTHKLAIICVDDEPSILRSIQTELENALGPDFIIELAQDGEEALEVIAELTADKHRVAVVIADYIMPGLKGDDLLIKIHAQNPRIFKIMLTGQANADAVGNVVNAANLYRYITKPWNKEDLITTVQEALHSFNHDLKLEEKNTVLTELNQYLEHKVAERTTALRQANRKLKTLNHELTRSNEALEQFAFTIAHDLRQPLQSIMGFAKLLRVQFGDRLDPPAVIYVEKIIAGSDRLQQMIEGLLAYAQVGVESHRIVATDCNGVMREVLANLQFSIQNSQAQITVEPLPTLVVNATQILQLLQNLLSNALKFARPHLPPDVRVWVEADGEYWRFGIRDNGRGIPSEECDRIFKLFHRVQLEESPPGSGIGLATCQKIVERYGGKIWAESQLGAGTTIYFTLPHQSDCSDCSPT